MNPAIANVGLKWDQLGIRNPYCATAADIAAFEAKFGLNLAPTVRQYFMELNGTKSGQLGMADEHLIGFWHLDQVRSRADPRRSPTARAIDRSDFVNATRQLVGAILFAATAGRSC